MRLWAGGQARRVKSARPREGGDPVFFTPGPWIPACAGRSGVEWSGVEGSGGEWSLDARPLGKTRKTPLEVGDQIFDRFKPDMNAHRRPSRRPSRRGPQTGAVEGNRQTFIAAPGRPNAEQLQRIQEGEYGRLRPRL